MSRFFLSFLAALTLALPAISQTPIRENQVPEAIREDFARRVPAAARVNWLQQGDQYFGVRYQLPEQADQEKTGEIIFLPDGQWVQTSEDMEYRDLPDAARDHCRANYSDHYAHEVKKLSTRKYGILYKVRLRREMQQVTMSFSMHGKLIEESHENLEPEKKPGVKDKLKNALRK